MSKSIISYICTTAVLFFTAVTFMRANPVAVNKKFTVVIDAGHGGRDPGAIGKISREKNINLSVALALGKMIESNCPDTRVVYTRKNDVFIPLDRRAEIANQAKADLFISIHTNALPNKKIARGTETYTLGMARAQENLDVAKRENAVILVEDDYKTRYEGFDPNLSESYIIFELMQDKYMEKSVEFASKIQKEFKNTAKRPDKGVHQAGFLVLRATSMPSVLVELGYITTPDEERYLNSAQGINSLSRSLYNAFVQYRGNNQMAVLNPMPEVTESMAEPEVSNVVHKPVETVQEEKQEEKTKEESKEEKKETASSQEVRFKVQVLTSSRQLHIGSSHFKGLKSIEMYKEGNIYKYTYGNTTSYKEAVSLKNEIKDKFPDAFIVAFRGEEKISLTEARKSK